MGINGGDCPCPKLPARLDRSSLAYAGAMSGQNLKNLIPMSRPSKPQENLGDFTHQRLNPCCFGLPWGTAAGGVENRRHLLTLLKIEPQKAPAL